MQSLVKLRVRLSAYAIQIGAALVGLSAVILSVGLIDLVLRRVMGLPKDVAFYLAILGLCSVSSLLFPRLLRSRRPVSQTIKRTQED